MVLCKHIQFKYHSIKAPRYHDKKVLVAKFRVGEHNKIVFTDAPSMGDEPFYISGKLAKKSKVESNGVIDCYAIPLDNLEPLEYPEHCEHDYN